MHTGGPAEADKDQGTEGGAAAGEQRTGGVLRTLAGPGSRGEADESPGTEGGASADEQRAETTSLPTVNFHTRFHTHTGADFHGFAKASLLDLNPTAALSQMQTA
jgi:hypothetical protein